MNLSILVGLSIFSILVGCFYFIRRFLKFDLQQKMNSRENFHSGKGSKEGKEYEKLALTLFAKRGYELSVGDKPQFQDFAIGREVNVGGDSSLGDIVFRYEGTRNNLKDQDTTENFHNQNAKKNIIFLQIKHRDNYTLTINSSNLTEANDSRRDNLTRDFNLRQYFTSYCNIKEAIKNGSASKELENGEIKYVVLFTNIDLDRDDFNSESNEFSLEEAPWDIEILFALKKSSSRQPDNYKHCYQLATVSDELRNIFKKCCDLHRLARALAQYVVLERYKNYFMGTDRDPIKQYHVALLRDVIEKTDIFESKSPEEQYYFARFRDEFINNDRTGPNKELKLALLKAMKENDKNKTDKKLKALLRSVVWKISPNFGQKKLPKKWEEKNASELKEVAEELAKYVTSESHRKNNIFGTEETVIKRYEVAFQREIIEITRVARFRDDFIDNDKTGAKNELLIAILEAIRKLDQSKSNATDQQLKEILKQAEWKINLKFGQNENRAECSLEKWKEENASELNQVAEELAKYVTLERHREMHIFGNGKTIKEYEDAFLREVLITAYVARFKDSFIDSDTTDAKQELLIAILVAIKKLDESKSNATDEKLKEDLKKAKWKINRDFGQNKLPQKWKQKKASEFEEVVEELAKYVTSESHRKSNIFGTGETPIKKYEAAFQSEIIKIACAARFRDDFIDNGEIGAKKELLNAILTAVRELDPSKSKATEKQLKEDLKRAKLKVVFNFGESENGIIGLPIQWTEVEDDDITDFLKRLVFSVKQPNVEDMGNQIKDEVESFLRSTGLGKVLDDLNEKFRVRMEKTLGIYKESPREEKWIAGEELIKFVQEIQGAMYAYCCTEKYEDEVRQYGDFSKLGELETILDCYLKENKLENKKRKIAPKILCIRTTRTLWSTIKILQYLNAKKSGDTEIYNQISIKLDDLKSETFMRRVVNAFSSEIYNLLTIECTRAVPEQIVELYYRLAKIIVDNPNKKIIIIIKENGLKDLVQKIKKDFKKLPVECNYLPDYLRNQYFDPDKIFYPKDDDIIVRDFKPKVEPFTKKMIFFQGQKEKINLEKLTGIADWKSYIADSSPNGIQNEGGILDVITLILKNEEITVGSRPLGTDSLECAYVSLPEEIKEINKKNLVQKFLQQGPDSNTNVIYIVSGISGSNRDKKEKLIQHLALINEQNEIKSYLGDIDSDSKIQITDDQFEDESFKNICHEHSEKEIFWIYTEHKNTFKLKKLFNPNFYLKRKFKVLNYCSKYLDCEQSEKAHIEENELIKEIKDQKIVIISGDPGMGKYTTMTKFYESKYLSESFLETHWIIRINLREKMSAVKNVKQYERVTDVVNFLSKFDSELDNDVTKSLLEFALSKRKTAKKSLILVLDGFDEILDGDYRNKIISLLEFLKEKTDAKVWITTLPLYKETLENKLMTFAIEFDPMNYELYIKQFFKDRLQLILNKEKFDEIFDERQENSSIQIYIEKFLTNMNDVFFEDASQFIRTPLHLYLMIGDSVNSFKSWVDNSTEQKPNFDYLGGDIREVYEKFINKKFDIYFNKVDGRGLEETRFTFDECNERLARCLISNVSGKSEKFLEIHKDKSSLAGIIKYYGSNVDFIATSFRDFFSAKSLMDWIQRVSKGEHPGINKVDYQNFLIEVLQKEDFELIRRFLNLEFGICFNPNNNAENGFEERLKNGKIATTLLTTNEKSLLIDPEGTVLHIAVEEGKSYIVRFLLNCFKEDEDVLRKFLFAPDTDGRITVILASDRKDSDTITLLLEAARGISENAFKELRHLLEYHRLNKLANDGLNNANNGCRI